jgi:hypothetical protein
MVAIDREVFARTVSVLAAFEWPTEMPKLHSRQLQVWLTVDFDEEFVSAIDFKWFCARSTHRPTPRRLQLENALFGCHVRFAP